MAPSPPQTFTNVVERVLVYFEPERRDVHGGTLAVANGRWIEQSRQLGQTPCGAVWVQIVGQAKRGEELGASRVDEAGHRLDAVIVQCASTPSTPAVT